MRVARQSLVACVLVSCFIAAAGCRGGGAADQDLLAADSAAWGEPMVFGFADAAFTLLLNDGELGATRARRAPVRQLATRMQRDYRALAARADSLADRRRVVPRSPSTFDFVEQHRAAAADLRNEDRRPFDDRYLDHVVTGHQRIVDRMYEALSASQDESVRRVLEDAQQRLETNLSEATRLRSAGTRPATGRRS